MHSTDGRPAPRGSGAGPVVPAGSAGGGKPVRGRMALRLIGAASVAAWAALSALVALPAAGAETALETAVKATFLWKFVPFVEFPTASFESDSAPVTICVIGDDPFGPVLDQAVAGQRVGERPIEVQRSATLIPGTLCHVLYAAGSVSEPVGRILEQVRGRPVLTVTDAARGGPAGPSAAPAGMIHFVLSDAKVRFIIDNEAAGQSGLTISSKLLRLALAVKLGGGA
jgi:hypothetical protein